MRSYSLILMGLLCLAMATFVIYAHSAVPISAPLNGRIVLLVLALTAFVGGIALFSAGIKIRRAR